jgi:hypothetical protein
MPGIIFSKSRTIIFFFIFKSIIESLILSLDHKIEGYYLILKIML